MGGYCYLNNAAIAVQQLRDGGVARVGVVDIDYHHGNGTQAIFWQRSDVFVTSLHADPHGDYPFFTGRADEVGAGAGLGLATGASTEAVWCPPPVVPGSAKGVVCAVAQSPAAKSKNIGLHTTRQLV